MIRLNWIATLGVTATIGVMASGAAGADGMAYGKKAHAPSERHARPDYGNWGGLYLGVNAGYLWSNIDVAWVEPPTSPFSVSPDQGVLGGHVGIQHQIGRIVVGLEASYSGTGPFGRARADQFPCTKFPTETCGASLNSLFTIGPRVGLAHGRAMFYGTGGFASAQVQTFDEEKVGGVAVATWNSGGRADGWFIGGGLEAKLHDGWVVGVEYLHLDLDTIRHQPRTGGINEDTRDVNAQADIVRARLSYMLGREDHKVEAAPLK